MRNFARLPGPDRALLFEEVSERGNWPLEIVEKDFWVCWMLERLWSSPFAPHLIFKGGTSLSKCFGLIQRFSEDIDIGLDRALLGCDDPMADDLSRSARTKRVEKLKEAAQQWIETTFLDGMTEIIRAELGHESAAGWGWQIEYDKDGMPKLRWNPPISRAARRGFVPDGDDYLNRAVLIEIGSRAAHWPADWHQVTPYVAQQVREAFQAPTATVCALDVERTFWEKATILHVLHCETQNDLAEGKPARVRERYSRHCYDLHCIANSPAGKKALNNREMLADVVRFKRTFFCSSKAKEALYDDAHPGGLRIAPHPELEKFFADDYAQMQRSGMFFGEPPAWETIRNTLHSIESRINAG